MTPTEPFAERLVRVTARYLELERIMLRGEFMTSAEMKEFAALWRCRRWELTVTVGATTIWRAPV